MLLLAWYAEVPWAPALLAAVGSTLEAGVPVWLLRRLGVHGIVDLRSTLLFIGLGAVLGPVFSATLGVTTMALSGWLSQPFLVAWLLWWLGNSLGVLVVGGFGLVVHRWREDLLHVGKRTYMLGALVLIVLFSWLSMEAISTTESPLLLYLLIPLVVMLALQCGHSGVFLSAIVAMGTLLGSGLLLPEEIEESVGAGFLYLDISLLWVITFTGAIVASAWDERARGQRFAWLATHDSLTSLLNRHEFMARAERAMNNTQQGLGRYVLLQLDLDHFKQVNDLEGHAAGDQLLRDISAILVKEVRGRDTVARLGGDEFVLLLENCSLFNGVDIAEEIRSAIERYRYHGAFGRHAVTVSIGLTVVKAEDKEVLDVLKRVDAACYSAKSAGRNHVWVDDEV